MMELLRAFATDARVVTILILMACQVLAAVFVAVKERDFHPAYLADFYRARVVPYIGGALIIYILTRYLPSQDVLGPYGSYFNDGLFTVCFLTLVWTLVNRLVTDLRLLGVPVPGGEPAPPTS